MSFGIYIHIPFCKQKCLYCDFTSFAGKEQLQERYLNALIFHLGQAQINLGQSLLKKCLSQFRKRTGPRPFLEKDRPQFCQSCTVFIGGGTPSFVDSKKIKEILSKIPKTNVEEITIEVNPGTVTKEKLEDYKEAGVNRLSIGLQSTKNELLKQIGRIHSFEDFLDTYKIAREVGFNNINVDLMIGLPKQTVQDVKESLKNIMNLKPNAPEHISVYSLILEEDTPMEKLVREGKLKLPDEEQERNMYWYVKNFLELNGYKHYEISNFAKPGFESKHNLSCWNQEEYIGFGIAAHSYIDGKRFCNISDIEQYIENIEKGDFEKNIIIQEIQDKEVQMKEYVMLGLRKIDGISIKNFKEKFNENPIMIFKNELNKLTNEGLLVVDGDTIRISDKGLDLANLVWEEFI